MLEYWRNWRRGMQRESGITQQEWRKYNMRNVIADWFFFAAFLPVAAWLAWHEGRQHDIDVAQGEAYEISERQGVSHG
jgi:hypothetical protein